MIKRQGYLARRSFVLGCALVLAGCAQPQLTTGIEGGVSVASVNVIASSSEMIVTGRPNTISNEQLGRDLTEVLTGRLAKRAGTTKADLVVDMKAVNLIPRGASVIAPLQSTSNFVLSLKETGSGKALVGATEINAISAQVRLPGLVGVATAPTVEKDYAAVLQGLANAVEERLYGKEE